MARFPGRRKWPSPPASAEVEDAMHEAATIRNQSLESNSVPERELLGFVSAVTELLGAEQTRVLTDIWLDELASMEAMPEPMSTQWRLVTLGAWARLARRLADVCFIGDWRPIGDWRASPADGLLVELD